MVVLLSKTRYCVGGHEHTAPSDVAVQVAEPHAAMGERITGVSMN
jgi:hypothetical protein